MRITRVHTRRGDDGTTGLGDGQRVPKDSPRVCAYGTVDELNSLLGLALACGLFDRLADVLPTLQNELFHLGSDLCFVETDKPRFAIPQIEERHIQRLENLIDEFSEAVGPLRNFILPGGSLGSAHLHVARTVCRRAEREVVALARTEGVRPLVIPYLNRLSDLLFVMARYENGQRGVAELLWNKQAQVEFSTRPG